MNQARLDLGISWIAALGLSGCRLKVQVENERRQLTMHPVSAHPRSVICLSPCV